jgi:hypothetical protein
VGSTPTFYLSNPTSPILLSTGDTNVPIAITASLPSYNISNGLFSFLSPPINPDYTTAANPPQTLPASSCLAALSLPSVAGVGTATGALSASPAGNVCSGIYVVAATAGGTFSSNSTFVVVPPQALMQGMYGEAHGQVAQYGFNDPDEHALGIALRNRLGDQNGFPGFNATYQAAIVSSQVNGFDPSRTAWTNPDGSPTAELNNAAAVFDGASSVSVANAKCFFSPSGQDWVNLIRPALNSGSTVLPVVAYDPGCYGGPRGHEQFVYKASISMNADGSGAPAFIFAQSRNLTDPAVIQIP